MEKKISEGGFAFVYKVTDELKKEYAIKRMILQDDDRLEGAKREAALWSKLGKHEHIVTYLDSELREIDGAVEMVILCELCRGGFTLINMLEQCKGSIPEHVVLSIMSDLAAGVSHMHKLGIAHWDLKVENVLMGANNKFKLADYGSA